MFPRNAIFGTLLLLMMMMQSEPVGSANILGVFSTFSPSHLIVHMSIMRAMADSGHNVTIVSMLKPKLVPHENITLILAPMTEERASQLADLMKEITREKTSMLKATYNMLTKSHHMLDSQTEFLMHPNLKDIYEQPQVKFDIMVLGLIMNDYQIGVAAKLDVPVILSWVGIPFTFIDDIVGNIYEPSYVPSMSLVHESGKKAMGFRWRMRNYLGWMLFKSLNIILDYHMNKQYNLAFGNITNFPSYDDSKHRIALLFYNYHSQSEGPVRPTMPQSIEIGGVQIKERPDPLPQELAEFLDNAKNGAIFFSLGTNVKMSYFKPQITELIYKVLARQPLRVIWKWEDLQNKPGNATNIYYHNWLPQDDILAHPNTKLFITHAGKGGIAEAQYHSVPMLALPVFGDQPGNAEIMVSAGFGLSLDVLTLTEESLEEAIVELLHNPVYRGNVRKFSALYRDRPLTARQSVVYWTDYVLRHSGAYHLQSPWLHLDFVARHNIDVYAALLLILSLSMCIFVLLLRLVVKQVYGCMAHRKRAQAKDKPKKH